MKSIQKFYKEHRVFIILFSVMLVGVILIFTILMQCFYSTGDDDSIAKYGTRLENIDKYKIDDTRLSDYEAKIMTDKDVASAKAMITGRIIYVKITYQNEIDLLQAENIALKSLENFSEEEKKYYDIHFTLTKPKNETSDSFLISGAKNKTSTTISWNNNRIVEQEQVVEKE